MKLTIPDWKSAWFDNHLNTRLFTEVSRLERTLHNSLGSSAQWMEQVTIEAGHLAQSMIRLESGRTSSQDLRAATEKAMRLSALGLMLMAALDANLPGHEQPGRDVADEPPPPRRPAPMAPTALAAASAMASTLAAKPPAGPPGGQPSGKGSSHAGGIQSVPWQPQMFRSFTVPAQPSKVPPQRLEEEEEDEFPAGTAFEAAQEFEFADEEDMDTMPDIASLSQVGHSGGGGSAMSGTIISLSEQGLSRAEIEVVTGQPRHIIDAVLANSA